jgi:chromosomal replication initiation ATPase DnaA
MGAAGVVCASGDWGEGRVTTAVGRVVAATAAHFGTPNILSRDRHKTVAFARQVAIYICRCYVRPTPSYPELGRWFGLDHTTAMAAVKRIERQRPGVDNVLREIRLAIGRGLADHAPAGENRSCSVAVEACS